MLCRVRQKISSPRSTWEESNEHSYEPVTSNFQQINESSYPEPVKNSAQNEFPMLPYILASKTVLPNSIGISSSSGFGSNGNDDIKPYASLHEDSLSIMEAKFLASATEGLLNPLKRKATEENELDFYAVNKKLCKEVDDREQKHETDTAIGYNFNYFNQWTSIMQPQ